MPATTKTTRDTPGEERKRCFWAPIKWAKKVKRRGCSMQPVLSRVVLWSTTKPYFGVNHQLLFTKSGFNFDCKLYSNLCTRTKIYQFNNNLFKYSIKNIAIHHTILKRVGTRGKMDTGYSSIIAQDGINGKTLTRKLSTCRWNNVHHLCCVFHAQWTNARSAIWNQ